MIRRFNRYELKYVVHVKVKDALIKDLLLHMHADPHADGSGDYRVTSLYYDSAELACFWAKIEGLKYRRKVRVRVYSNYGNDPNMPAMVEIKQRINRTVQKRRVVLPLERAYALCDGSKEPDLTDPQDRQVVQEVQFLRDSLDLKPACVISYSRTAFVGSDNDPGLRVTFDKNLTCRAPSALLDRGPVPHHFMSNELTVLEVKANDAVPLWITKVLARHGCHLQRISKYCAGIAQLRDLRVGMPLFLSEEEPHYG